MNRFASLCILTLVAAACATAPPPPPPPVPEDLPGDAAALIALADAAHTLKPPDLTAIWRGWAALTRAQAQDAAPEAVSWRKARAAFLLSERLPSTAEREHYARIGRDAAQAAISAQPGAVEGHYYLALNLGNLAELTRSLGLVKPMVSAAARAAEIDPAYDDAGPLLFLGKTYLSAPGWPLSIGDVEKAIDLLQRAVALRPTALARLFLAQAYAEDGRTAEATQQLRQALATEGPDALDDKWRAEGQALRARLPQSPQR